ncbi:MAG TPA: hypothetical protein VF533_22625 [Solirubrobacteraceae bacterium]|jgi:hypothetical protein
MTKTELTYLIAGVAALASVVAWAALVVVPAWTSYSRVWERLLAVLGSLYVLAAFVLAGVMVAGVVLYFYDELPG